MRSFLGHAHPNPVLLTSPKCTERGISQNQKATNDQQLDHRKKPQLLEHNRLVVQDPTPSRIGKVQCNRRIDLHQLCNQPQRIRQVTLAKSVSAQDARQTRVCQQHRDRCRIQNSLRNERMDDVIHHRLQIAKPIALVVEQGQTLVKFDHRTAVSHRIPQRIQLCGGPHRWRYVNVGLQNAVLVYQNRDRTVRLNEPGNESQVNGCSRIRLLNDAVCLAHEVGLVPFLVAQ